MTKSILVVCLGNICRSPLAEAILKSRLEDEGMEIRVDGAGVDGWHAGNPPDARAVVAARLKGYDITKSRARLMTRHDFDVHDLILTMDTSVHHEAEALRPAGSTTLVKSMTEFGPQGTPSDVPDPYYTGKFTYVIELLETCIDGLVDQLRSARQ